MEAVAEYDHVPTDPEQELGFKKGDHLLILNYGDDVQWYDAEMNKKRGLVPCNYISIDKPSWYMGRISRNRAELILMGNEVDGAFLVRLSESSPSDFSLSVKCGQSVQHFRILKNEESKYFLWSQTFYSLNELVAHYRKETVSRTSHICLRDRDVNREVIVQAIYDFQPTDEPDGEGELEFKAGDLITVTDQTDDNWWCGILKGTKGYFPKSYVKKYDPPTIS